MAAISWALEADFDRDGSYETDLTGYVEAGSGAVRVRREIRPDGSYAVSELSVVLSNRGRQFTPDNLASPFAGQLVPGVPVRVTADHDSNTYTVWTGYAQRWRPSWPGGGMGLSLCEVTCYDLAYYLQTADPVNVVYSDSRSTDEAVAAIATAAGFGPADLDLGTGEETLGAHYVSGQNPLAAITDAVQSELGGHLWISALGQVAFRARSSWLGVTPDATWGDGTEVWPEAFELDIDPEEYITSVRVRGTRFLEGQADTVMFAFAGTYRLATAMALSSGQVWERVFSAEAPYVSLTTPIAYTDYAANDSQDGTGTDRTGSLGVTLTDLGGARFRLRLVNGHSGTVYVELQVRGQPVNFYADRPEAIYSLPVPGEPASPGADIDIPFARGDGSRLLDLAVSRVHTYRYPSRRLTLDFASHHDGIKAALLALELGDLVAYADSELGMDSAGLDDWWRVVGIEFDIPPEWSGQLFTARVSLDPSYLYRNLDAIRYDSFTRDDGALGTSASGHAWAAASSFAIASSKARPTSTAVLTPHLDPGVANVAVEVRLSNLSADTDEEAGVVYRYADGDNYWRAVWNDTNDRVELTKRVAGTPTVVAAAAVASASVGELRVLCQGNRHRVYWNRLLVIDVVDAALNTNTKAGLYSAATTVVDFDDFYVEGL
jgi:hypothetical protein